MAMSTAEAEAALAALAQQIVWTKSGTRTHIGTIGSHQYRIQDRGKKQAAHRFRVAGILPPGMSIDLATLKAAQQACQHHHETGYKG
jgi:hypothetical protein